LNKVTEQTIQGINIQFYRAFESLSLERMEEVWKHSDDVVCVHPGWDLFRGWTAVRESWVTIFQNTERIQFLIANAKVRLFENKIAVVVCIENIETIINQDKIRTGVIATNIFERQHTGRKVKDEWRMIHHHGSPISDYIPPNVSV
jgi:ketosteroid isomerase-like protein